MRRGGYGARLATTDLDLSRVQDLRAIVFRDGAPDHDAFDAHCRHLMVEDTQTGALICAVRLMHLPNGAQVHRTYAAQFYDLASLSRYAAPMVELGRFCIHPDWLNADVLRVAWGALTAFVDENRVGMLFGCTSFAGTDPGRYTEAFALLRARHLAPARWRPGTKAMRVHPFGTGDMQPPRPRLAHAQMPQLLRTYLTMGGWVSDHAVIDRDLGTLHVFTGLEVGAVPPTRARLLRAVAG